MDVKYQLTGPSKARVTDTVELPHPCDCTNCKSHLTHSELVCCLDKRDNFFFQCHCGNTICFRAKDLDDQFISQVCHHELTKDYTFELIDIISEAVSKKFNIYKNKFFPAQS